MPKAVHSHKHHAVLTIMNPRLALWHSCSYPEYGRFQVRTKVPTRERTDHSLDALDIRIATTSTYHSKHDKE